MFQTSVFFSLLTCSHYLLLLSNLAVFLKNLFVQVANKLFLLPYASESIEKFARSMLLSVVDQQVSEVDNKHLESSEQTTEVI